MVWRSARGFRWVATAAVIVGLLVGSGGSAALARPGDGGGGGGNGTPAAQPLIPRPVAVTVNPATTAVLLLDFTQDICNFRACLDSLPRVERMAAAAHAAGVPVLCTQAPVPGDAILPQIASLCTPPVPVVTSLEDKFHQPGTLARTGLKAALGSATTLVIAGTNSNGAVMYTSFEANLGGYTVVVATDGISDPEPFVALYTLHQLVDVPVFTNLSNQPLKPRSVTLSTTRLIHFGA